MWLSKSIIISIYLSISFMMVSPAISFAGWGAWDEGTNLRGEAFHQLLKTATVEAAARDKAGLNSPRKDALSVVNYVTNSAFSTGKEGSIQSYKVGSIGRLTRTPMETGYVRYEMQPLLADFKNEVYGEYRFAFPAGARKTILDRNPVTEQIIGGNLPTFIINSVNAAVQESERPLQIEKMAPVQWKQPIKLDLTELDDQSIKSDPTQFKVTHLSDGSLFLEYAIKHIEINSKEGIANLSAKGFAIVDSYFNVLFLSGLAYSGMLTTPDGVLIPVSSRKVTQAQGVGFDVLSIKGLQQKISNEFLPVNITSMPHEVERSCNLENIYAAIDPAISIWDASSQAVAERRSNIAPVVALAVTYAAIDSTITLGVNAYGAITGNKKFLDYSGTVAEAAAYSVGLANNGDTTLYAGQTQQQWAETVVGIATNIVGMTGTFRAAAKGTIALIEANKATINPIVANASRLASTVVENATTTKITQWDWVGGGSLYKNATDINSFRSLTEVWGKTYDAALSTNVQASVSNMARPIKTVTDAYMVPIPISGILATNGSVLNVTGYRSNSMLSELSSTLVWTDNFLSITPILTTRFVIIPGDGTFVAAGSPSGPTTVLPSELISFSASTPAVNATGALAPISNMTLLPILGAPAFFGVDSTYLSRVSFGGSPLGLQYSDFGTAWLRAVDFISLPQINAAFAGGSVLTTTMPQAGSATYFGSLMGAAQHASIHGSSVLSVNFSSGVLNGIFNYTNGAYLNGTVNMTATISGNGFNGTVASIAGQTGSAFGHFYGPAANEISGAFSMTGANTVNSVGTQDPAFNIPALGGGPTMTVVASFGAKK